MDPDSYPPAKAIAIIIEIMNVKVESLFISNNTNPLCFVAMAGG